MGKQYVVYEIAGVIYGVPIEQVQEIVQNVDITDIPKTKKGTIGVVEYRGQVTPIHSLRLIYGEPQQGDGVIIMVREGENVRGYQVDKIRNIETIEEENIDDMPEKLGKSGYIDAVGIKENDLIMLVDLLGEKYKK